MSIPRGFLILGLCTVLFVAELLLYWARTNVIIPLAPVPKIMMFLTVTTAIVGISAPLGAMIERFGKRKGIGNYVVIAAVAVYAIGFFIF